MWVIESIGAVVVMVAIVVSGCKGWRQFKRENGLDE